MVKRRFKVEKLIRDDLPSVLEKKKIMSQHKILTHEEYIRSLYEKLKEEALEVSLSFHLDELREELADVMEVFNAILAVHQISFEEIETMREHKQKLKGSFKKKIYCEFVEMDDQNPHLSYYEDKSDQYPEIKY